MNRQNILDNCNEHSIKYILIIGLLLFCGYAYGQPTTQGRDFWITFGRNLNYNYTGVFLQVRIVAPNAANVKFTFTKTGYTEVVSLAAGSVYTRDLSETEKEAVYADGTGVSQKSLHIESDEDISVYAINFEEHTTDATGIFPVNSYGTSYYYISYPFLFGYMGVIDTIFLDHGYLIMATEYNTNLYINNIHVATLNKGDVYSKYFIDKNIQYITSDKPVAFFTAHTGTNVHSAAVDCLYEQLLPESSWGVSYMVPVTIRGKERVIVSASRDNTTVTHIGGIVVDGSLNLNKGEYVELEIYKREAGCYIEADKPVAVTSYLMGIETPGLDYSPGDPSMAWIPATDQFVKEITVAAFIASGSSVLEEHHILIITPTVNKSSTQMRVGNNGYSSLSGGEWSDHLSGYSYYSLPVNQVDSTYSFKNPAGLAILGYGLGYRESYYYLAGSSLRRLDAYFHVNDIYYQDLKRQMLCVDSINVKDTVHYDMHTDTGHLRWFIDDVEETEVEDQQEWSKKLSIGRHKISMVVKNKYGDIDTLQSSLLIGPVDIEIADMTVCQGEKVELKIENTFDELTYSWFYDANYTDTIAKASSLEMIINADAVFYIEAAASNGCTSRDSVTVVVNHLPELISKDTSVCYNTIAMPIVSSSDAVTFRWYSDIDYTDIIAKTTSFVTDGLKSDTVFYVETVSDKGCISRDNVEVTVDPLFILPKRDINICSDSNVEITSSNADRYTIVWYNDNLYSNIISRGIPFRTGVLETDTVLYVEAISHKNCTTRDSIMITITTPPVVVAMDDHFICYGDEVKLEILQFDGIVSWNVDMETVSPTSTQQYIVTASRPPCPDAKDTVTITVGDSLYILPSELDVYKTNVYYSQQLITNAESPVFSIINNSLPEGVFLSTTGIMSSLNIPNENYEPVSVFTVQVDDKFGCETEKEYTLEQEMVIPKAFSPNGDDINDFFMKGYKVIIFDRMGVEIFRGDDGWDGTYKGKPVHQDIYFYQIEFKNENRGIVKQMGYVGIIEN